MTKDKECCGDCYECTLTIEEQNELIDCDLVDGRFIGAVSEYASTCDGCGELTHHDFMTMDMDTQLGYCPECTKEIRKNGVIINTEGGLNQ